MLLRIPSFTALSMEVPNKSVRGYEFYTDFIFVDRRRFARSYRRWRKRVKCDFYDRRFERMAGFRVPRRGAA